MAVRKWLVGLVGAVILSDGAGQVRCEQVVTVPATAAIQLAGQPDGTVYVYGGVAPTNSPILIDLTLVGETDFLSFAATGVTARDPILAPMVGADGETLGVGNENAYFAPRYDLSGWYGPFSSLVGVFTDSSQTHSVPPTLDFGTSAKRSFAVLTPELQQVFYIGDGLTGFETGDRQYFKIPTGADRLYLGLADEGNYNNVGQLQVSITAVPEPSTLGLISMGFMGALGYAWRRRYRRRAA